MIWAVIFREVFRSLRRNRLRSVLTMLGIVAGVATFICVIGVGQAGTAKVEEQLAGLGDNLVWVEAGSRTRNGLRAGARGTRTLVLGDAMAILEQVPQIRRIAPNVDGRIQVTNANRNWNTQYRGVTPEYLEVRRWRIRSGFFFTAQDVEENANVCVLGQTVVDNLFRDDEDPVGQTIRVNQLPCKVIGTLVGKGASATGQDQDDFITMPITTVQKKITGTFWLDDIYCSATSPVDAPEARRQITGLLRERHHLTSKEDDDFNIRSPEDVIQAQLAAARIFAALLASAAALSLLVGGIGIMNIMMVSVTERTREIGIRLAVGATEQDVQTQFLLEAVMLSVLGGALGIAGGFASAYALKHLLLWEVQVTPAAAMFGGMFSTLIGILFGYYPAFVASRLDPIAALRFE